MKTRLSWIAAAVFALVSMQSHAVLMLTPADATATSNDNSNFTTLAQINAGFGTSYTDLTLQYKSNVGSGEEGPLAGSYSTVFSNTASDPSDADISWDGGAFASCPVCILIVKDGSQTPAQYLFDLGGWDGMETIELRDFWPAQGAISNVALWAGEGTTVVPEPGALGLLGIGLIALGWARRRKA